MTQMSEYLGQETIPHGRVNGDAARSADGPENRRILVVEDDDDLRELLCDLLQMQGYQTEATGNGESAVRHSLWADTVEDEGKIWREWDGIFEENNRKDTNETPKASQS